jgi:hypothetical protein
MEQLCSQKKKMEQLWKKHCISVQLNGSTVTLVPTTKSVSRIIIREQPELIA